MSERISTLMWVCLRIVRFLPIFCFWFCVFKIMIKRTTLELWMWPNVLTNPCSLFWEDFLITAQKCRAKRPRERFQFRTVTRLVGLLTGAKRREWGNGMIVNSYGLLPPFPTFSTSNGHSSKEMMRLSAVSMLGVWGPETGQSSSARNGACYISTLFFPMFLWKHHENPLRRYWYDMVW